MTMTSFQHNDAAMQQSLAQALDPGYFPVDERTPRDLLAFAARYARLINFFDQNNRHSGDWSRFFLKDPVILTAAISKTAYKLQYRSFRKLVDKLARSLSATPAANATTTAAASALEQDFNRLFELVAGIFSTLDHWVTDMELDSRSYPLKDFVRKRIGGDIGQILSDTMSLRQCLAQYFRWEPAEPGRFHAFAPLWRLDRSISAARDDDPATVFARLRTDYEQLFSFYIQVINSAAQEFEQLQTAPNDHPDTALLITFVKLMGIQQAQVNTLTQRHLDFYYQDVLQLAPAACVPDQVFVRCQLKAGAAPLSLPAGTAFVAGSYPDQTPVLFASTAATTLTQANIAQAFTAAWVTADSPVPGQPAWHWLIDPVTDPAVVQTSASGAVTGWDLFGGANAQAAVAGVGFIIESPELLLPVCKGQRSIVLTFTFAAAPPPGLAETGQVFLSTAQGWYGCAVSVSAGDAANQLVLTIALAASAPAIVPLPKDPQGFATVWPALKVMAGSTVNLCQSVMLTSLQIAITVSGGGAAPVLYGDGGPLPADKPVQMFGPVAALGGNFYVGSSELFGKNLQNVSLTFNWAPFPAGGLTQYYSQYNNYLMNAQQVVLAPFSDSAFNVAVSVLQAGAWVNLAPAEGTVLFQTTSGAVPASTFTLKQLPASLGNPSLEGAPLPAPLQALAGYLRFTLSAPIHGFGNTLYPQVISWVTLQNAATISAKAGITAAIVSVVGKLIGGFLGTLLQKAKSLIGLKSAATGTPAAKPASDLLPLPPAPFIPVINSLAVNYGSGVVIGFDDKTASQGPFRFSHVSRFATYTVAQQTAAAPASGTAGGTPLFPLIEQTNALYLALTGLDAGSTLTLYFELAAAATADACSGTAASVAWHYLSVAGWKTLTVLNDSTVNMSCSGIVELAIPDDISNDSVLMPAGTWLKLVPQGSSQTWPQVTFMATQGLSLRRQPSAQLAPGVLPALAPLQISGPAQKLPTLDSVLQPFASFSGRAAETGGDFRVRVAGRLNDKDRCVASAHYTDLLYQAFPQIYYARPVPNGNGEVYVGLVKSYADASIASAFAPAVSLDEQVSMKNFLQARSSPMVSICTGNLAQQQVRITAVLDFADDADTEMQCRAIAAQLKLLLSPWIQGELTKPDLAQGLKRSDLIRFLLGMPQVLSLVSVTVEKFDFDAKPPAFASDDNDVIQPRDARTILVSANDHAVRRYDGNQGSSARAAA
ncbi:MAG TPA: hypothetical protein VMH83_11310 [Candidatus Acidoferrum sp.]|nr:hypothetical protein [Candidatus Acidoferrum sp.]